jgi:ribosomal-protein-alanine N-acetyltransferase
MFKELITQRLTLKNIDMNDINFMYQQFSDDFINQYLFDAEPLNSLDEAKELIEFYLNTVEYNNHRYIIINENNKKIGTIGFHN